MEFWVFFGCLLAFSDCVFTSKILIIPYGMYSHINLHSKLGKILKDDGHEVWALTFDKYAGDMKKQGLIPITYPLAPGDDLFDKFDEWTAESPDGSGVFEKFLADEYWVRWNGRNCHLILGNAELMGRLRAEKFDLIVWDGVDEVICHLMIPYILDVPFITVHSFQVTGWVSGTTGMPSIEPEVDKGLSNRMDFWQRLDNLHSWYERLHSFYYDMYAEHMDKYCPPNKPKVSLKKVAEMSEIFLMNYEIMCLDYPRVSAPNTQYLGAGSATAPKPLPQDLEDFVSSADYGIVLMTLGSMQGAQQVWKLIGPKIFEAFSRLPQKVIVQYRLEEIHGRVPANVKLLKWVPQNDLLGHTKTRLFVMHGGNNGQNEAVYHGVPMLVVPIYMDQIYNGKRIQAHAYGDYVHNKTTITVDDLYNIMSEIINNNTYSENIKKCSGILKDMPTAQEKFVFWVNHILKFSGAHLRPPSLDMPLYQVLMLDIVGYYLVWCLGLFHLGLIVAYCVFRFLRRTFKAKKD